MNIGPLGPQDDEVHLDSLASMFERSFPHSDRFYEIRRINDSSKRTTGFENIQLWRLYAYFWVILACVGISLMLTYGGAR